eukprot:335162_1
MESTSSDMNGTTATESPKHKLQQVWAMWFIENTKALGYDEYENALMKFATFSTVEDFWACYSYIHRPSTLGCNIDYYLFVDGIKPMWEDPGNQGGGHWALRLKKGVASRCWEDLILAMIGGQFEKCGEICGAAISMKKDEDVISVWHKDSSDNRTKNNIREALRDLFEINPNDNVFDYREHTTVLKGVSKRIQFQRDTRNREPQRDRNVQRQQQNQQGQQQRRFGRSDQSDHWRGGGGGDRDDRDDRGPRDRGDDRNNRDWDDRSGRDRNDWGGGGQRRSGGRPWENRDDRTSSPREDRSSWNDRGSNRGRRSDWGDRGSGDRGGSDRRSDWDSDRHQNDRGDRRKSSGNRREWGSGDRRDRQDKDDRRGDRDFSSDRPPNNRFSGSGDWNKDRSDRNPSDRHGDRPDRYSRGDRRSGGGGDRYDRFGRGGSGGGGNKEDDDSHKQP